MCSSVRTGDGLTQIKNTGYNSEIWLRGVCLLVSEASTTTGIIELNSCGVSHIVLLLES